MADNADRQLSSDRPPDRGPRLIGRPIDRQIDPDQRRRQFVNIALTLILPSPQYCPHANIAVGTGINKQLSTFTEVKKMKKNK